MTDKTETADILRAAMSDPEAGWSMGSFGAIAEFHHVAGDPAPVLLEGPEFGVVTARGGIRLDRPDLIRPVAHEMLSPRPHRWQQGVSLCLPDAEAAMARRSVLSELGPDAAAIRAQDRGVILFDMGLDQAQVDFCIRTDDADLIAALRAVAGQSVFAPGNPAMGAILAAHPHRVALTRIGRVEVYQKIGGPDTGGVSPAGPHTHVLPKLLRAGRTHSANTPIPEGLVPVGGFHPASPVMDPMGQERDFDPARFAAFQRLLGLWGDPAAVALKQRVWARIAAGDGPEAVEPPDSRFGRVALRNALRQARRRDGESGVLLRWLAQFDREALAETEDDPDAPGH